MLKPAKLVVLCSLMLCETSWAASLPTGIIDGTLEDSLGQPIASAEIMIETAAGKTVSKTLSDRSGHFQVGGLTAGQYAILAHKTGFQPGLDIVVLPATQGISRQIVLASKQALELTVHSHVSAVAHSSVPENAAGSTDFHMSNQTLSQLPQGADTPFNQVLLQAPGVVQDSFGQLHVRGDHANLQYRINGILLPESIAGFGQTLDTRFVNNINFLTGALPAEYGYRTAGVVNIQTQTDNLASGGNVEMTVGDHQTSELSASKMGHSGNFSYYIEASALQNNLGIENPMPTFNALHDASTQNKGFAWLSWTLNDHMRLSIITSASDNRFQIPDLFNQTPQFTLAGVADMPSNTLNEQQSELTRYGLIALQGTVGASVDYQVAVFSRYSNVNFGPDIPGDLIYTGVASSVQRSSMENGIQTDINWLINAAHTWRNGFFMSEETVSNNSNLLTFPANAAGIQTSTSPESLVSNSSQPIQLFGVYSEDEWKLTQNLTLDYGLRWDAYQGWVNGDQLGPRAGLRWQVTPATVLHAGYAHYFTPPPSELISNQQVSSVQNTTNAQPGGTLNDNVKPETTDYWDAGVTHQFNPHWSGGLDGYYEYVHNLLDEGQFGSALLFTPFNYQLGKIYGLELTANYHNGNLDGYFNLANSVAMGKNIVSAQYNFAPNELNYIANNWIHLDHDQTWTASGGLATRWQDARWSLDMIYGSGLRNGFANTTHLPGYAQFNTSVARDFQMGAAGAVNLRLAVINLLDSIYEIRDGTGVGVGAPQYGQRRTVLLTANKTF